MPTQVLSKQQASNTLLAACYAAFFVLGMAGAMVGPAKDVVTNALGLAIERGGLLVSAQFVGATVGIYLCGRWVDRADIRVVMCGAGLLMAAGLALFGLSRSFAAFFAAEVVMGLGMGGWAAAPNIIFAKAGLRRPTIALNLLNAVWGIGAALGPQVVHAALGGGSLSLGYYGVAILATTLLPIFWRTSLRLGDGGPGKSAAGGAWRPYLPFALIFIAYVGTENGFGAWVFTQITAAGGALTAQGALAASLFWAGLTIGRLVVGVLLRHVGDRSLLIGCAIVVAAGAMTMVALPRATTAAVIASFVIGLGCAPIFPTTYGWIIRALPETSGVKLATLQAVGSFGAVLVPPLQGYVGGGRDGGMIVIACLGIALALLFSRVPAAERTHSER